MPYIDSKGRIYKYGEFFPSELSPFCYNETIAQEYFPLTKEQAIKQGYKWKEREERNYTIDIKNEDIIPIRTLSFQALFIYFAVQARQKIFDAAIKAQLKVNPHPLEKYRTNCPLSRLELFRSLYNIKKGDKMWWHSTDTIW
jgi:predicted metalloendopeptidase